MKKGLNRPRQWQIKNEIATFFYSEDEVSIGDTTFARKVGASSTRVKDKNVWELARMYVGVGENVYTTEGHTKIKITLNA